MLSFLYIFILVFMTLLLFFTQFSALYKSLPPVAYENVKASLLTTVYWIYLWVHTSMYLCNRCNKKIRVIFVDRCCGYWNIYKILQSQNVHTDADRDGKDDDVDYCRALLKYIILCFYFGEMAHEEFQLSLDIFNISHSFQKNTWFDDDSLPLWQL